MLVVPSYRKKELFDMGVKGSCKTSKKRLIGKEKVIKGIRADAWAYGGDEGRGKLRKALGRRKQPMIQRCPNGATQPLSGYSERKANPGN